MMRARLLSFAVRPHMLCGYALTRNRPHGFGKRNAHHVTPSSGPRAGTVPSPVAHDRGPSLRLTDRQLVMAGCPRWPVGELDRFLRDVAARLSDSPSTTR